ncbi:MAG: hypothetical protein K0R27_307 [Xanthobacteraceae bacterium]|jgi:hypothetical protein|nr:hypothetical protein [Xanthobacteraceae bacterium]
MRLKALDQMHVSAVKSDSLRPGEEFEVSDSIGADLLKRHPGKFVELGRRAKAEAKPRNKAEPAPSNKSPTRRKPSAD